jgi:ATP-dependent Clp protease protease subunit
MEKEPIKDEANAPKNPALILFDSRTILLSGTIDTACATAVTQALLALDKESQSPIQLIINSPGGSVADGLAIIDTMALIDSEVDTVVNGGAYSMGAVIASCGKKRYATPHSEFLLHQVIIPEAGGSMQDLRVIARHGEKINITVMAMLAYNCKRITLEEEKAIERDYTLKDIAAKTKAKFLAFISENDRDHILDAYEALDYHLIDEIVGEK